MRIAHLDTGRGWRGGQAQVLHLIRGLMARGHACTLLAPEAPLLQHAREAGADVVAWSARGDMDAGAVLSARQALASRKPDVVHGHTARAHIPAVFAGRACGARVVVARRVTASVATHALSRWKYRLPVDRYLCVSDAVRTSMLRSGIDTAKLVVVRSGVVLDQPEQEAGERLRDLIGASPHAPVVGTVASLTDEKGSDVWVDAAGVFGDAAVHWVWIGEGPLRDANERRVTALGLQNHVHFLGFREHVRALMGQFTVFVLPALQEGLGTSILDAQVLGVPVIASNVGGITEIIDHDRTGWLISPNDAATLATAVHQTLADQRARARWTAAAREHVRRFGIDAMVEGTLREYHGVTAERSSSDRHT